MHVLDVVAPTAVEYVPIAQLLHVAGPIIALYCPATHCEHVLPSGPVEPALHVQAVETELPKSEFEYAGHVKHVDTWLAPTDAEYVPMPQSTHAVDPASALCLPATHSEHVPPSGPPMPAVHLQSVTTVLPDSECEPAGHSRQFVPEALYFPGPHVGRSGHCT